MRVRRTKVETRLAGLYSDEQPSRSDSKGLDLGDPVDIITDLETLFVDGRRGALVGGFSGGFLGEEGGHLEWCGRLGGYLVDWVVELIEAGSTT